MKSLVTALTQHRSIRWHETRKEYHQGHQILVMIGELASPDVCCGKGHGIPYKERLNLQVLHSPGVHKFDGERQGDCSDYRVDSGCQRVSTSHDVGLSTQVSLSILDKAFLSSPGVFDCEAIPL